MHLCEVFLSQLNNKFEAGGEMFFCFVNLQIHDNFCQIKLFIIV